MIAKGKAISHGGNAVKYAMKKGKMDRIVGSNLIGGITPEDIIREMEMVNSANSRCRNKYIRFEIGIAPQDEPKLNNTDITRITTEFANRMGLQSSQWIACTHKDTDNRHIHIVANRIGIDGKVFDTSFISNRSARIAEEISRDMGLVIAKDVQKQKEHKSEFSDAERLSAKTKLQNIAYSEIHNRYPSLEGFIKAVTRRGVTIEPVKNQKGDVYGLRFQYQGHTFKASEIGNEFGYRSLAKQFDSLNEPKQTESSTYNIVAGNESAFGRSGYQGSHFNSTSPSFEASSSFDPHSGDQSHSYSNDNYGLGTIGSILSAFAGMFSTSSAPPEEEFIPDDPYKKKQKKKGYGMSR